MVKIEKQDFRRIRRQAINVCNRSVKNIQRGNALGLRYLEPLTALRAVRNMRLRDCTFPE